MDHTPQTIGDILEKYAMTKKQLSDRFSIPYRTIQNWTLSGDNHRDCPLYIILMMDEILKR